MTEIELQNLMTKQKVEHSARQGGRLPVATNVPEFRGARAWAIWLAVQTKVWLKEHHANPHPIVEKIWKFENEKADVDMRVGKGGVYTKFKVTLEKTGPLAIRLRIQSWDRSGKPEKAWDRYGEQRGDETKTGVYTFPPR